MSEAVIRDFEHSSVLRRQYDERYRLDWCFMKAKPRPCFTPTLLAELASTFAEYRTQTPLDVDYYVLASDVPGTFNLGGDLALFQHYIHTQDRAGLLAYAKTCVDSVYEMTAGMHSKTCGIVLVQGDALGGGFECAMAGDVLIAERGARMGLPEILFNLFPGMGAYSLLSRRIGPKAAERMILSGHLYEAEELYEMGVVDRLAEPGEGVRAVYDFIDEEARRANGAKALREAKRLSNPVSYDELYGITEIWVDAALKLTERDLRMMERLVKRQSKRSEPVAMSA
jgi:DSF synthase